MVVAGIICEYDPFHLGHAAMIDALRKRGADAVVCAMSGSFVQRGEVAAVGKAARAEMALRCGADLVLELPSPWSCAPAETFAAGGVQLLQMTGVVTELAFGSECGDLTALQTAADALESPAYRAALAAQSREEPFAVRRRRAVEQVLGEEYGRLLTRPNDILALAYLRALHGTAIRPVAIRRVGAAHDGAVKDGVASASHIRELLRQGETENALALMPPAAAGILRRELEAGRAIADGALCERAMLDRLRRMDEEDFAPCDDSGEGLYHRLYRAVQSSAALPELLDAVKTKRYPTARLRRMLLRAWLELPARPPERVPYLRLLAASETGRSLLRRMEGAPVLTKAADVGKLGAAAERLFRAEARRSDLYALACPRVLPCGEDWRLTPVF